MPYLYLFHSALARRAIRRGAQFATLTFLIFLFVTFCTFLHSLPLGMGGAQDRGTISINRIWLFFAVAAC